MRKHGRGAPRPCAAHTGALCPHTPAPRVQIKPFVSNADTLLRWSKRLLPEALVHGIVKRTFFAHFCGGASLRFVTLCHLAQQATYACFIYQNAALDTAWPRLASRRFITLHDACC